MPAIIPGAFPTIVGDRADDIIFNYGEVVPGIHDGSISRGLACAFGLAVCGAAV